MKRQKSWILLFILYTYIFVACSDKQTGSLTESELVSAELSVCLNEINSGIDREITARTNSLAVWEHTRSASATDTPATLQGKAIIYQFDASGAFYYKTSPFDIELTCGSPAAIPVQLRPGNNLSVYIFVAAGESQLPVVQSEEEISEFNTAYETLSYEDNLLFHGKQTGIQIVNEHTHNLQKFDLTRICSKLIIDYRIVAPDFIPQEIRLHNVPAFACYDPDIQSYVTSFRTFTIPVIHKEEGRITVFIPENKQGSKTNIINPEDKNIQQSPVRATYFELVGSYQNKRVTFRLYPGANSTSDFNLRRNHWYRIGLSILNINLDDARVDIESTTDLVIQLVDGKVQEYKKIRHILLNNGLWISDFKLKGSALILNYTSTPGSYLHEIGFYDEGGRKLFGGRTGFYFDAYNTLYFSHTMEAQGNGSAANPYLIFDAAQLKNIRKMCQNSYINRYYLQKEHLNMYYEDRYRWTPIGDKSYPFTGVYDGDGYQIKDLTLNTNSAGNNQQIVPYAGLFGYTRNSVLRRIHLRNGEIACKANAMGSLVGYAGGTQIEECSSSMVITQFSPAIAGGLVGELSMGIIRDSYYRLTSGEIHAWNSQTYYTGGIAGEIYDNSKVENVYSVAPIWIGNYQALGAIIGMRDLTSSASNFYAEIWKNTGGLTIGSPKSQNGLMENNQLKQPGLVNLLNNRDAGNSAAGKWKYQPEGFPKLHTER